MTSWSASRFLAWTRIESPCTWKDFRYTTKGDHLYGLDQAREPIRQEGLAITDLVHLVDQGEVGTADDLLVADAPASRHPQVDQLAGRS